MKKPEARVIATETDDSVTLCRCQHRVLQWGVDKIEVSGDIPAPGTTTAWQVEAVEVRVESNEQTIFVAYTVSLSQHKETMPVQVYVVVRFVTVILTYMKI